MHAFLYFAKKLANLDGQRPLTRQIMLAQSQALTPFIIPSFYSHFKRSFLYVEALSCIFNLKRFFENAYLSF
ncbi:MAG: hypothetical protein A2Y14_04100 [Verrucomicrobia bacterium GWF2_51_19]|nr:MAG: hypothetical protein A2Y14_04100 [Verrucomicrobia bacterium GWF2_51_19]HCJ11792.1 hypothetical protein [Opitutae bacterium]